MTLTEPVPGPEDGPARPLAWCPVCEAQVDIVMMLTSGDGTIKRINGRCPEHGVVEDCTWTWPVEST